MVKFKDIYFNFKEIIFGIFIILINETGKLTGISYCFLSWGFGVV